MPQDARTALVTGASRGIGRAIALRLAREGLRVIAIARRQDELDALAREIEGAGGSCRTIALDLRDGAKTEQRLAGLEVDVLVHNAGLGVLRPFMELTPDDWAAMVDVNVNALYHGTRPLLPGMMQRGRGHIVVTGSIAGRSAFVGGSCYAATKAFATSFAESLMLEVRDSGVKVSVVMPGSVNTDFFPEDRRAGWMLSPEDVAESVWHVVDTPQKVLVHRLEVRPLAPPLKG